MQSRSNHTARSTRLTSALTHKHEGQLAHQTQGDDDGALCGILDVVRCVVPHDECEREGELV